LLQLTELHPRRCIVSCTPQHLHDIDSGAPSQFSEVKSCQLSVKLIATVVIACVEQFQTALVDPSFVTSFNGSVEGLEEGGLIEVALSGCIRCREQQMRSAAA